MSQPPSLSSSALLELLRSVKDPELPVIDVVELGIVRGAEMDGDRAVIRVTPTYSGCPALSQIEQEIRSCLLAAGVVDVRIEVALSPAWTTDWLTDEAKEKLRAYGIAPPPRAEDELVFLPRSSEKIPCPFCASRHTELRSEFGSTACKAFFFCRDCRQPFEYFKAH